MKSKEQPISEQLLEIFTQIFLIRSKGGTSDSRADEELTGQIGDLRKKLATSKVVAEIAKRLQDAKKKLAAIEHAIVTRDAGLLQLDEQAPDLSELFRQRADLLAEIELGDANGQALEALDKKIAAESKTAAKQWEQVDQEQENIGQMIEGLKRKAEVEQQEIDRLIAELDECSLQAVLAIVLDKAELYTKHATAAVHLYREITTLNEVVKLQGWGTTFNGLIGKGLNQDALIPALNAPPFAGEYDGYTWNLLSLSRMAAYRRPVGIRVTEIDALRKAGAALPDLPPRLVEE